MVEDNNLFSIVVNSSCKTSYTVRYELTYIPIYRKKFGKKNPFQVFSLFKSPCETYITFLNDCKGGILPL